jgi:hypothetical protein
MKAIIEVEVDYLLDTARGGLLAWTETFNFFLDYFNQISKTLVIVPLDNIFHYILQVFKPTLS